MNNCTIYDKSFLEDLINKKNSINNASINFAFLSNLISNTSHLDDTWTPLFITRENSSISDTLLLDKGYVAGYDGKNNTLGIQNFLTIANPQFNFWTTSGSMVSDWVLNRQNISHFPIYGLLCWFKKLISPQGKKLSLFPNNSRLKLLGTNRSFIKVDNTTLYETNNRNKQSSKFDSDGSIKFEYDNTTNSNYTTLSSVGENALFVESDIIVSENRDGLTTTSTDTSYSDIIIQSNKYLLWIPDGDVYSYYINNDEHNTQNNRLSPRSFCSPSLYTKYNSIYHKLTFELIRTGAYRQTHIARCYKNLAKYLSTSPFTDEYSISRLLSSTVKDYTDTFLQTSGNNTSIILYLNQISSYFNSLDTVNNVDHRSITNNIIYNLTSLKEKIVEKYGAKLVLSADGVISSKKPLVYGANVKIDQFSEYYISSGTTNSIIYANQNISVGDLLVQTDYADKKSKIRLRFKQNPFSISSEVTDLYMWDAARPIVKSDPVNELNLVLAKTTNNINLPEYNDSALDNSPDTVIFKYIDSTKASSQIQLKILPDNLILDKYRTAEDSFNPSDILIKNDFICKWERISGPELRFIDESKLSIVSSDDLKYNQDTKEIVDLRGQVVGLETLIGSPQVYVLPSKAGRYQVKCTINSPYGTFVKIKTFYVVSGARPEDLISERLLNEIKAGISTNVYILPIGLYAKRQEEMLNPLGKKFNIEIPQVEPVDTFFNVIGQLLPPGAGINRSTPVVQPENLVYPDPIDVSYVRNRERVPIKLNPKNLRVHAPIINSIAIHGRGLALPIATNGEVKVDRERPTKLINNTFHYLQDHFGGPIRADRSLDSEYIYDKPSALSISYSLPNGLKYKIDKIRLERIRHSSDPQCANCLSLYNNNLYGYRKGWGRSLGAPILSWENDAVSITNGVVRGSNILTDADEQFSTDFSPPIKTYGGWDGDTREKIGIEIPGHPNPETIFPPVTGRPLNYLSDKPSLDPPYQSRGYKYCFEDVLQDNTDKYLNFEKGVFHPQSGWIPNNSPSYNDVKNLSSVLKFNPGARESYSFNGPNIESIQNDSYLQHEGHTYIIPNKFSSSITLKLEEGVQPIVRVGPCNERSACRFDDPPEWEWLNQIHREYADQETGVGPGRDHTHGFRVLRGGGVKRHEAYSTNNWFPSMDEFGFNGGLNNFDYGFTVTGPPYPPGPIPQDILDFMEKAAQSPDVACVNDRGEQPPNYYRGLKTPTTLWRGIRRPAVWNFTIRDLEVRLNFLNYVNTKDISIVFESGPCVDEANRIFNGVAPTYQSPIFNFPRFVNQTIESDFDAIAPGKNSAFDWPISPISVFNSGINNYLSDLSKMNTTFDINKNSSPTPPFLARSPFLPQKLCLLNQEYIQNHSYNLSIKFSDSANKYNVLNDHNYNSGNFIPSNYQNIIPTNGEIRPSICPFGYSDKDINIYHNIVLNNKLNIVNNTFSKYSNKSLFNNSIAICPGAGVTKSPTKTSGNTFKCIIYVYDEHDDMLPNDNTINSQLYTNIYDFTKNINTSDLYSSLCSWELLFHVGDTKKPTTPILNSLHSYGNHEALSLIEYGKPPQYGGYSFIANLKEYKHMLPFVNINAPNIFFQDYSLCSAPKSEIIGRLKSIPGVEFPWLAILAATYAYSGSIGLGGAGGLVGLSAGIALGEIAMSLAIQQIVNYFSDLRVQEFKEDVNNDIYQQDYLRYPFGSPEKILVNFSKDGIFWYKAEASIFKYRHTPVLEHKKYNYIRLGKDGIPALSRFNFEIITDIRSLLDEKYIKTLSIKCEDKDTLYGPQTIDNTEYNFDDIVDVTFTDDEEELCDSGLYYVPNSESWISLSGNPTILCEKNDYISYNQILFNDNNTTERNIFKNFHTSVANKQLIMLEGSVPYEIFDFNDIIHVSGSGIAADPARVVTLDIDFTTSEGMALYQQNVDPITGELRPIVMKDEEPTYTTKIIGKALVYKNNKPYSVLRVDRLDMDKVNFIMPDNNVVVLFDTSSSTDMSNNPTNMYAFNKEIIKDTDMPEVYNTTNSYGSYGDGSYNTKKNILSYFPKINNIENIYTIFNNYNTDMLLKNNMFFSTTPDNMFTGQAGTAGLERPKYIGSSVAYPHKIQEVTKFVSNTNRFIVGDENNVENIENILDNLKSLSFNNIEYNNAQLLYVKNNSFKTSSIVPSPTGYVSIENDYEEKIPIAAVGADGLQLSETEYNNLISKLNLLENNTENTDIESLIGQKTANATNQIINTYNLSYMYRHYESLTEYDANKKLIELALTVFYKERNDILKLLNEISKEQIATIVLEDEEIPIVGTILSENQSFIWIGNPGLEPQKIDKNIIEKITRNFIRDSSNIRPQKFAKVSSIKPFDRSSLNILAYNITYEINNDDYWINLDPHQSCTIAEELRPKVLKKIEYVCRPANFTDTIGGTPILVTNNICNNKRGSTLQNSPPDPDGINYKQGTRSIRGASYEAYIYDIGENIINSNKASIANKATAVGLPIQWKEIQIRRNYHINGNNRNMGFTYNYGETLVTVFETYDVLLTQLEIDGGVARSSKNTQDADVSAMGSAGSIENIPIIGNLTSGAPAIPPRSPSGFGLLDRSGLVRTSQSLKIYNVCNLDDINNLKIKIRKMPRQLRGIDVYSTVYRYGRFNLFRPPPRQGGFNNSTPVFDSLPPTELAGFSENQPVYNNNMYYWKCMEIENNKLIESTTPLFFQLMNEMMYRTFFGSVDRIENRDSLVKTQFLWEMIPYEFLNKIPPSST